MQLLGCGTMLGAPVETKQLTDVVVLKDGSLVRGNITLLAPEQFVVIRLGSGELQKYALSDARYAGPIINMPELTPTTSQQGSEASARATTSATGHTVTFEGSEPNLTLHLRTEVASDSLSSAGRPIWVEGYRALCTAPCSVQLRPLAYRFSVSHGADAPMLTEQTVFVREPLRLLARVHTYEDIRFAGAITVAASCAVLLASVVAIASDCYSLNREGCGTVGSLALLPALPVSIIGLTAGIVLGTRYDWAEIVQLPTLREPPKSARLSISGRF